MSTARDDNPGSGFGGPRYPGTFLLALREAIEKLKWQANAWQPATVECVDADGKSQRIGLENLYRRLRQEPRERWPDLLADLLNSVTPDAATLPEDFSAVVDRLMVRLGPPSSRIDAQINLWSRPLVDDQLVALLVIDSPNSMSYVTEKLVADSGQDADFWFAQALNNLSEKSPLNCVKCVHEETGLLQAQFGDAYDSSRALLLDVLAPGHDENGFFAIVPGRDHLLFVPVKTETMVLAPWLRAIAGKTHREMPYPISPKLFWVRRGVWHHFLIETEGEDILVKPPAEFADVIERTPSRRGSAPQ